MTTDQLRQLLAEAGPWGKFEAGRDGAIVGDAHISDVELVIDVFATTKEQQDATAAAIVAVMNHASLLLEIAEAVERSDLAEAQRLLGELHGKD